MWFAALGTVDRNPWLVNLMARILQGAPADILDPLVEPFGPLPKFIKVDLYQYKYTSKYSWIFTPLPLNLRVEQLPNLRTETRLTKSLTLLPSNPTEIIL